jgi:L-fuconolactonase
MTAMRTPVIDSHFHAWQPARGDYGWLTPQLAPLYRDVAVADWLALARPHGVTGGVLVQAAPTEAETAYLLGLAEADPAVQGVVGWVDLLAADAPQRIARLAKHPKLKGLRPMLQDIPDPDWVLQRGLDPAFSAMVEHGLVFDALIKPVHLPRIVTLAQRHRSLRIVVDHGAKPDIAGTQWQPWADELARVAMQTTADCKLSGLLTEAGPAPRPDAARRWAAHVLACFGTRRVLWGSDWPVLELASDYAAWWREMQAVLTPLPPAERAMVLGGNAMRAYRL